MTIVHTSVWIDYLSNQSNLQTEWLDVNLSSNTIGLPDLVLVEALQGIRSTATFETTKRALVTATSPIAVSRELSVAAAQNYRFFRERGITVRSTFDCIIATLCIENDCRLLHRDRDFDHFERELGLQVIKP